MPPVWWIQAGAVMEEIVLVCLILFGLFSFAMLIMDRKLSSKIEGLEREVAELKRVVRRWK